MTEKEFKNIYEKAVKEKYPSAELTAAGNRIGWSYQVSKKKSNSDDIRNGLILTVIGGLIGIVFYGSIIGDFACVISIIAIILTVVFAIGSNKVRDTKLEVIELDEIVSEYNRHKKE